MTDVLESPGVYFQDRDVEYGEPAAGPLLEAAAAFRRSDALASCLPNGADDPFLSAADTAETAPAADGGMLPLAEIFPRAPRPRCRRPWARSTSSHEFACELLQAISAGIQKQESAPDTTMLACASSSSTSSS